MQQLPDVNHSAAASAADSATADTAAVVLDVGLLISRFVRAGMWQQRPADLTVAQFRALAFINAYPKSTPSALAEYLMLARPAVTRLVDDLVDRRLATRRTGDEDRRQVVLGLTAAGRRHLDRYFASARALIVERLAPLSAADRRTVKRAMTLVRGCFEP